MLCIIWQLWFHWWCPSVFNDACFVSNFVNEVKRRLCRCHRWCLSCQWWCILESKWCWRMSLTTSLIILYCQWCFLLLKMSYVIDDVDILHCYVIINVDVIRWFNDRGYIKNHIAFSPHIFWIWWYCKTNKNDVTVRTSSNTSETIFTQRWTWLKCS